MGKFIRSISFVALVTLLWLLLVLTVLGYIMYFPYLFKRGATKIPRAEKYDFIYLTPGELSRVASSTFSFFPHLKSKDKTFLFQVIFRLSDIWSKSGVTNVINYMSESIRLIMVYLSGENSRNTRIWVKVAKYKDGSCLPFIIPLPLRAKLRILRGQLKSKYKLTEKQDSDDDKSYLNYLSVIRLLVSIFSLMRSMSQYHKINLSSITSPFTGNERTLKISGIMHILNEMKFSSIKVRKPRLFLSTKSGVNSSSAFISISFDLMAFMINPSKYLTYVKLCWSLSYYTLLFIFISNTIILTPLLVLYTITNALKFTSEWLLKWKFPTKFWSWELGRLAIVKEARGKARVIGITDHWTQWLLKPLHDAIYKELESWPEDGTSDQLGPIKILLKNDNDFGLPIVSVDLTAATDRLPVDLQADILTALGYPGTLWKELLARPYLYKGQTYTYSVGQPMGVYSSFAMLALTNHLLCVGSIMGSGYRLVKGSGQYAVLGDDVVIRRPKIAKNYVTLLNTLGVDVNPIKGFNGDIVEFAKRLYFRNGVELSPIGAKAVTRASRSPLFLATLLADMVNKGFLDLLKFDLQCLETYLVKIHSIKSEFRQSRYLLSMFGPQGGLWSLSNDHRWLIQLEGILWERLSKTWGVNLLDLIELHLKKVRIKSYSWRSPFTGTWEGWKSLRFLIRPLVWYDKRSRMIASSQTDFGHIVALTILPTPLFLISRDLLDRFFSSVRLLMLLPFIVWVTERAPGLKSIRVPSNSFMVNYIIDSILRFRDYIAFEVKNFIEIKGMLVSTHFVRTNSFMTLIPAQELITMQLSRTRGGSDSVLKLTDELMSSLSKEYSEKLKQSKLAILKLLKSKRLKRLKKRNNSKLRSKGNSKRKRYT